MPLVDIELEDNKQYHFRTSLVCIGILEILFGILTDDSDGVLSFHVFIYLFMFLFIFYFLDLFFFFFFLNRPLK